MYYSHSTVLHIHRSPHNNVMDTDTRCEWSERACGSCETSRRAPTKNPGSTKITVRSLYAWFNRSVSIACDCVQCETMPKIHDSLWILLTQTIDALLYGWLLCELIECILDLNKFDRFVYILFLFVFGFFLNLRDIAIKKVSNVGTSPTNSCPVCGVHLMANELETHFLAELDRLYKLSTGPERQRIRASFNMSSAMHLNNGMIQGPDSRWEVSSRHTPSHIFHHFCPSNRDWWLFNGFVWFIPISLLFGFLCTFTDIPANTNKSSRTLASKDPQTEGRIWIRIQWAHAKYPVSIVSSLPWPATTYARRDCSARRRLSAEGK